MISVVMPCFEEQDNIPLIYKELTHILADENYELIFIDDGSKDATLSAIRALAAADKRVRYISFARNFGHQIALRAGLEGAAGACVISLDADMQHPPTLIPEMLRLWREGVDIVQTRRIDTRESSLLKRTTSAGFYWILRKVFGVEISPGAADFRLLDRKAVDALNQFQDPVPFYRGFVGLIGFRSHSINYEVGVRRHGASKYSIRKMISLARAGIVTTTVQPLRFATVFAFVFLMFFIGYSIYVIYTLIMKDNVVPGWASVTLLVSLVGFVHSMLLAILGEYIAQISISSRGRPIYIVKETDAELREAV